MHYSTRWRCCFQQQYLISTQPLVVAPLFCQNNTCSKEYLRHKWNIASQALICDKKAFPSPCPSEAPFTKPAISVTFKNAGTLLQKKENGTNIYKIVLSVHFVTLRTFFFCCNLFLNFQGRHQKALTSKSHQLRQSCTILSPPPIKGKFTTLFVFHIFALQFEVVSALTFIHKLTLFWGPTSSSKFEKWSFGTL